MPIKKEPTDLHRAWSTDSITTEKATGHHNWGAERPIAPNSASVRLDASDGELSAQVLVSGPVTEPGLEGRKGYWAGGTFSGFEGVDLPLEPGRTWTNDEGATATYRDGKLVITRDTELSLLSPAAGLATLPFHAAASAFEKLDPALGEYARKVAGHVTSALDRNWINHQRVEIEVTPGLKTIGGIQFTERRQEVNDSGEPIEQAEVLNELTLSKLSRKVD